MQATVFKKYDIRGIVDQDLIIADSYRLAQAIVTYFKQQQPPVTTLIVGMDGRIHSLAIKEHVCRALQDMGINVIFLGVCPTPLFYFANEILDAQGGTATSGGIMITASHNPKQYNGFKLMLNKKSVFDREIQAIKELFFSQQQFAQAEKPGFYTEHSVLEAYIDTLTQQFAHLKNKSFKAILDCAHGATAVVIPELVQRMGWNQVQVLYGTIDGNFPAHEANPTTQENMQELQELIKARTDTIGIGFDGDGDRMAAITEQGTLVCAGDELTYLFCQAIKDAVGPCTIVVDIKCANALLQKFKEWNVDYTLTPCGIGYVRQAMRTNNAVLGGELSCHFCFKDRYFGYDDGIYAMMRLFELLYHAACPLHALHAQLPARFCSSEIRLHCDHEQPTKIVAAVKLALPQTPENTLITIDGIRLEVPYGCATVRASNTEPIVSIRFEGTSTENLDRITHEFYTLLLPYFDGAYLMKHLKHTES